MKYHPATIIPYGPIGSKPMPVEETRGPLFRSALGERVKFVAVVSHFSTRRHWSGITEKTIVLKDICFADNHVQVVQEQTYLHGVWSQDLHEGLRISFTGKFETIEKRGVTMDAVLRPGKVEIL